MSHGQRRLGLQFNQDSIAKAYSAPEITS